MLKTKKILLPISIYWTTLDGLISLGSLQDIKMIYDCPVHMKVLFWDSKKTKYSGQSLLFTEGKAEIQWLAQGSHSESITEWRQESRSVQPTLWVLCLNRTVRLPSDVILSKTSLTCTQTDNLPRKELSFFPKMFLYIILPIGKILH